jgi:hypothetical protein
MLAPRSEAVRDCREASHGGFIECAPQAHGHGIGIDPRIIRPPVP